MALLDVVVFSQLVQAMPAATRSANAGLFLLTREAGNPDCLIVISLYFSRIFDIHRRIDGLCDRLT
ncbi:hypothetical protein COO91_04069 [Nostoc flagelliforme CCNUN1]|uniref:Uncharacterized protein n=1 Tax=Nostoc flagelliforme CCNUN1 TaxID=2038116 RepID=A0A2K8SRM3_9NOSO|nr:hypothetical protein COO91_04069 [Nostoc flagelliforme CCNUN1]